MSVSLVRCIISRHHDDVVRNVQRDFEEHEIDETVLNELKRSWELKVAQMQVVNAFPLSEGADGNGNYPPGSEALTTVPSGGATSADGLGGHDTNSFGAASLASLVAPNQMESSSHLSTLSENTNTTIDGVQVKQDPGANSPTRSGALMDNHGTTNARDNDGNTASESNNAQTTTASSNAALNTTNGDDGAATSNQHQTTTDADRHGSGQNGHASGRKARRLNDGTVETKDDEDAINSDLDDSDEEAGSGDGDEDTPNIILCQYEKVARTKNKWKCVLKDGVMTMDGRDYVFHRANGDFEW
ncbi:transcription factor IIA, alpha/beta subunit-domain-containing protein [Syncephalis fuscata]|nr:transcription factor IIA, alpha/beta subunit-domain-containing protein [Syncephalis fuscata]